MQGNKNIGWGLQCQEDHCHRDPLGYVQDVCDQVRRNEKDLQDKLAAIDPGRVVQLRYEGFCKETDECIDRIVDHIPGLARSKNANRLGANAFDISMSKPLSDAEEEIIGRNFPPADSLSN